MGALLAWGPSSYAPGATRRGRAAPARAQSSEGPEKEEGKTGGSMDATINLLDALTGGGGGAEEKGEEPADSPPAASPPAAGLEKTISLLETLADLPPDTRQADEDAAEDRRREREARAKAEAEAGAAPPTDKPKPKPSSPVFSALMGETEEKEEAKAEEGRLPKEDEVERDEEGNRLPPNVTWSGDMWERWDIPWGFWTVLLTLLGVEGCFVIAGVIAPLNVFSDVMGPDYIPSSDPNVAFKTLLDVTQAPENYYKVFTDAEVLQTVLGFTILALALLRFMPLAPELFHLSLGGSLDKQRDEIRGGPPAAATGSGARMERQKRAARDKAASEWLSTGLWGGAGTAALVLAITAVLYATGLRGDTSGAESNTLISQAAAGGTQGVINLFVCTCLLAPLLEETVFRGFMLPSLTKWMPTWAALGVTTLCFAFIHQHNTGDTVQLTGVGLVAGLSYLKTRNLATPMMVHCLFNFTVLTLYFIWVS